MNKFSVYVHVPWCRRRCPYCNFYLVVGRPSLDFLPALIAEWQHRSRDYHGKVSTIYFGGGTPSLLPADDLTRFVDHLVSTNHVVTDAEITLEANPEDLSNDYIAELKTSPINRISLGVQSFDDGILRALGRKHSGAMARDAITKLQDAGLCNISVDQIIGVPDERSEHIIGAMDYLAQAQVPHVSCYLLTIEEGTRFAKNTISPSDDAQADIYTAVQQALTDHGYVQYDISSYAQNGMMSRHNQAYWSAHDYLGVGPGAHSMRRLAHGGVVRVANHADLKSWLKAPQQDCHYTKEALSNDMALREALAFGLRNMACGVNAEALALRHKADIPAGFNDVATKYSALGWLDIRDNFYIITSHGALFADAIMRDILCC